MGTGTVKKKNTNHTEETGIRVVRRRILQEDPQGDRLSSASFWWMTGLCFLSASSSLYAVYKSIFYYICKMARLSGDACVLCSLYIIL